MNVVVGGGWSGLAAAVELARRGLPVTLIEAATDPGGRARTILHRGEALDNGQHLLIGACTNVLDLIRTLGLDETALFERRPLELRVHDRVHPDLRLRLPRLPAPLHLIAGIALASGLSMRDRRAALRLRAVLRAPLTGPDRSVAALLRELRQTPRLIDGLWRPLCLATLNTPIETASAQIFARVLRDAFSFRAADSDLLLPRQRLGALLPEPALRYIEAHGGRVFAGRRVESLDIADDRVVSVTLDDARRLDAAGVILALPPTAAARLLAPHAGSRALAARLDAIAYAPICTVCLEYPHTIRLPLPMIGFTGGLAQWAFDLSITGKPGWISVVVSGDGDHMKLDNTALARQVIAELSDHHPDWPSPLAAHVLREKRATFICDAGIEGRRPGIDTPLANCLLAGDAVANGRPATLEGAIANGLAAARAIAANDRLR